MKKIICAVCAFFLSFSQAFAIGGYKFYEIAELYTNTSYPQSVAKDINSADPTELAKLKKGTSSALNLFRIAEFGDASIMKAAKDGNITKIHYVDTKVDKIWLPFIIYVKEVKTIVYGE